MNKTVCQNLAFVRYEYPVIHTLDHPNQINYKFRPLMKAEAKFLSYWSRILFLLFAVSIKNLKNQF